MELSCKTEYTLLALLELTGHYNEGEPLQIRQIAAQQQQADSTLNINVIPGEAAPNSN